LPIPANAGVVLLSVGNLIHRKGHDLLVEALARLTDLRWSCRIVGSLDHDPEYARRLARQIAGHGLQRRIHLLGARRDLDPLYAAADLFVLASRHEGYGMVFAEAMRHGLPVIATTAGAIPEAVPADAGLLVPPEDVGALEAALRQLIEDPAARSWRAAAAQAACAALPSWRETGRRASAILTRIARAPAPA